MGNAAGPVAFILACAILGVQWSSPSYTVADTFEYPAGPDDPAVMRSIPVLTLAGEGDGGQPFVDVTAGPKSGRIYVSTGGGRVEVFTAAGGHLKSYGEWGSGFVRFRSPAGLAVDGAENLYAVDSESRRVIVLGPEGEYVTAVEAGTLLGPGSRLFDVAVTDQGSMYIADGGSGKMLVTAPGGGDRQVFPLNRPPGDGEGHFTYAAVDGAGGVYLADGPGGRILHFKAPGQAATALPPPAAAAAFSPRGIALLPSGRILAADAGGGRIFLVGDGETMVLGDERGTPLTFDDPRGVAGGDDGLIYVVEGRSRRVRVRRLEPGPP